MIKGFLHSQRTQRGTEGFFNELKNWNIEEAKELFTKHDVNRKENIMTLSPFYPICCSFKIYDSAEVYKNWIIWIHRGWQWEEDYNFYYLTTDEYSIVELKFPSPFIWLIKEKIEWWYGTYIYNWEEKLFESTEENRKKLIESEAYKKELEKVKRKIDELYN